MNIYNSICCQILKNKILIVILVSLLLAINTKILYADPCDSIKSLNSIHITNGRANGCGAMDFNACTTGDGLDLGAAKFTMDTETTIYNGNDGKWYKTDPSNCITLTPSNGACGGGESLVAYSATANGSITNNTNGDKYYSCVTQGNPLSLTAFHSNSNYSFSGWDVLFGTVTPGANSTITFAANDDIGLVAQFTRNTATPNIIEPNIVLVIDDSKYMNSELYHNSNAGSSDSNISYYNSFLNYRYPTYNTASSSDIGGGILEKCSGYNRSAFNPYVDYKPWDGYLNRVMSLTCDGATTADISKEELCPKLFPEENANLSGTGCTGSGCTSSLTNTVNHVVPRACKPGGCESLVNIDRTQNFTESMGASIFTTSGGCGYTDFIPGNCETYKYWHGCTGFTALASSACATITWEGGVGAGWWNPQLYTCLNLYDVRWKGCALDMGLTVLHPDDYTDAVGNPIDPSYTTEADFDIKIADAISSCGGSILPNTSYTGTWSGGHNDKYAWCNGLGQESGDRPYPNIMRDTDRKNATYVNWADANTDGNYNATECGGLIQMISLGTQADKATRSNYANWFTYHRTRLHLVKGALIKAISDMKVGRVAIYKASGGLVSDFKFMSNAAQKQQLIDAVLSMTASYSNGSSDYSSAYNNAVSIFDATTTKANEKWQFADPGSYDVNNPPEDSTAHCRQNHVVIINGANWSDANANNLRTAISSKISDDLCPDLDNSVPNINTSLFNKNTTDVPEYQHVKTSIFDISPNGSFNSVNTTKQASAPGADEISDATWQSFGVYQRVFKQNDISPGVLPNISQDLGNQLRDFLLLLTDSNHNIAPNACQITSSTGKRISWKELQKQ